MANRHLVDPRNNISKILEVLKAQVMACIKTYSQLLHTLRSLKKRRDGGLGILCIIMGIRACIELYSIGTCLGSKFSHTHIGIDED